VSFANTARRSAAGLALSSWMSARPPTRLFAFLVLGLLAYGCTIELAPVAPNVTTHIPIPARIEVTADTAATEFRTGDKTILVGKAVAQYAQAYLGQAFPPGDTLVIDVRLDDVSQDHGRVKVALKFAVSRRDHEVFTHIYDATGTGNGWDALMGTKDALRESTNVALRSVFKQFLHDAEHASASW
jgi:hypothetical protein